METATLAGGVFAPTSITKFTPAFSPGSRVRHRIKNLWVIWPEIMYFEVAQSDITITSY